MLNLKNFFFFKLQRVIGSRVESYYKEFLKLEKFALSNLQLIQQKRCETLLKHAISNVPYYRDRVSHKKRLELSDFPILSKIDIRKYYYDLMTAGLRHEYKLPQRKRLYSWIEVKTGGTTGMPTTVIHDKEFRDRGRAGRIYSQYLCGFPLGVPYFRLWGSMRDINQMKDSFHHRVISFLNNEVLLNAFKMNNKDIERYIEIINKSKIQHMMAYVDAAYQIARYVQKTGKKIKALKSIMACASTVTEDIRNVLQETFQAKVHNKYGSRECADIACECDKGGMHIYSNNVIIEVVDQSGNPLPPGKSGRILITLLSNYSFPLVRYEIGDMGAISNKMCDCGRPFPLIDKLEGRTVEHLYSNDGGYVTPNYIIHLIGVVHNPGMIRRFQLIQNSLIDFELKIEIDPNTPSQVYANTMNNIIKDLRAVLGERSNIKIHKVDSIPKTKSGKFLYTINRLNKR